MTQLDANLIRLARRAPRQDGFTDDECIAMNLLWRKDVSVPALARVFQCSRNTIYYNCLTGEGASYPSHRAIEINKAVDAMIAERGAASVEAEYIPSSLNEAVNAANREIAASHRVVRRNRIPRG